jgi:hypothetical protein
MARIGAFDRHLEPLAWWEAELLPAGWYVDELLVEPVAGGVTGTLTATLGSATLSATGTGPTTSSAILIPSSNNPSYRSGFYSPRRGGTPKYPQLWDGCVGAWCPALGQSGLTSVFDQSAYQNHGASNLDASYWVVSGGATALRYGSANTTINNALRPISGTLTLSFWFFNTGNFTGYSTPFDSGISDLTRACSVFFGPNNNSVYCAFGEPIGGSNVGTGMGLQLNTWTHLAVTVSGTTATIYKNGVSFGSTSSGVVGSTWTNNRAINIGDNSSGGGSRFSGNADDFRLYNRALTPYEIKLLATRRGIAFESAIRKLSVSSAAAPTGSVSSTLANATLSSSGTLASGLTGSVSAVLADASLSSTGTLAAGASGSVTRTLDATTLVSSGTVGSGVTGTVSVTLAAATLSASGTLSAGASGSVTRTLDSATLSSTGTVAAGASGTVTRTLDNATLSSTGGAAGSVSGSVSSTLAAVTCSATATLAAGLSGSVTRTLDAVTSSATGTVAAGASGSVTRTLADATLVSSGSFSAGLTAQVNRALDSCVVSSSGTLSAGATGTLSVQLASATLVSGNVALGGFRLNVAGEWKNANAFVKVTGTWKNATPFVKVIGVWK